MSTSDTLPDSPAPLRPEIQTQIEEILAKAWEDGWSSSGTRAKLVDLPFEGDEFEVALAFAEAELANLPETARAEEIERLKASAPKQPEIREPEIPESVVPTRAVGGGKPPWLPPRTLYGLAGDVVRTIDPHTEADPMAVLIHFLVMFGNAVGPTPFFQIGADFHRANEFAVIVGDSSRGRKGTSEGQARRILRNADEVWEKNRIASGISTGEGLIQEVRDPRYQRTEGGEEVLIDSGAEDKRLLVTEAEFASPLKLMRRDGNILSTTVRQAWDSGNLRTLTKRDPLKATGAYISIIGHITTPELLRHLESTDASNGFANRFLWVYSRRSKLLPLGGNLTDEILAPLYRRVAEALQKARNIVEIRRDAEADALWKSVYGTLTAERFGLYGSVTSRAEAHVVRLSLIYALIDGSPWITTQHLNAALALWDYCSDSAKYIFGSSLGDPVADRIIRALRETPEGLTRKEISDLFSRNLNARDLERALGFLMQFKLARCVSERTSGRSAERWFAC